MTVARHTDKQPDYKLRRINRRLNNERGDKEIKIKTDDLTGKTFERLTVLYRVEDKGNAHRWLCKCKCGNTKIISGASLKYGTTKSCGCLRREMMRDKQTKHGMSDTRFYRIWQAMITRCTNERDKHYSIYGGRGITVATRWRDFENFKKDMYESYLKHAELHGEEMTSIDRINSDGNYEVSNCKWSTPLEQVRNRKYKSGHAGVNKSSCGRGWVANIGIDYKLVYLGFYKDKEGAIKARKQAEEKYWR